MPLVGLKASIGIFYAIWVRSNLPVINYKTLRKDVTPSWEALMHGVPGHIGKI